MKCLSVAFLPLAIVLTTACGAGPETVVATPERPAAGGSLAQPILDMHLHAREAAHYGPTGLPMCAPVERMPRWDQRLPLLENPEDPPLCSAPLISAATDAEILEQTLSSMVRHRVFGVLGGSPGLVAAWQRAAPGRFIAGLDVRFDPDTGAAREATPAGAPVRLLPPDAVAALHQSGALRGAG